MKTIFYTFCLTLFMCLPFAHALDDTPLHPKLAQLAEDKTTLHNITLSVDYTAEDEVTWQLTPVEQQVFLGKLLRPAPHQHPDDVLYQSLQQPNASYKGLVLKLSDYHGRTLATLRIFNQVVTDLNGHTLRRDPGRTLELWLFGTATLLKHQLLATQLVPIFSFNQCLTLGNLVIETTPRQCLLPDNNLLLDVPNRPTPEDLKVATFDDCLQHGKALINVFPRRCMAAGGRVFTEPPRLIDPLIESTPKTPVDIDAFLQEYRAEAGGI